MDIGSKSGYPSSALSNFAPHPFVFQGVECKSMEGLLQAFKFEQWHIQIEMCKLVGIEAKRRGRSHTKKWQKTQTLWWKGVEYDRHGKGYQELLDEAYDALATNEKFCKALLASGQAVLKHAIGRTNARETVLTVSEFTRRLTRIRERLQG